LAVLLSTRANGADVWTAGNWVMDQALLGFGKNNGSLIRKMAKFFCFFNEFSAKPWRMSRQAFLLSEFLALRAFNQCSVFFCCNS